MIFTTSSIHVDAEPKTQFVFDKCRRVNTFSVRTDNGGTVSDLYLTYDQIAAIVKAGRDFLAQREAV